jgi:hypothetical protein
LYAAYSILATADLKVILRSIGVTLEIKHVLCDKGPGERMSAALVLSLEPFANPYLESGLPAKMWIG